MATAESDFCVLDSGPQLHELLFLRLPGHTLFQENQQKQNPNQPEHSSASENTRFLPLTAKYPTVIGCQSQLLQAICFARKLIQRRPLEISNDPSHYFCFRVDTSAQWSPSSRPSCGLLGSLCSIDWPSLCTTSRHSTLCTSSRVLDSPL